MRSEIGREFRRAFVPAPGCELLVADYNQIELRCIAHLAQDPGLIESFNAGRDIHTETAARVFGVAPEDVTIDQRSKAKMVSYGLAYGMEAYGLGQRLNIPTEEAALILEAYFQAFPAVREYMERTVPARQRLYRDAVRAAHPRAISPTTASARQERQAMNAGIQPGGSSRLLVSTPRRGGAVLILRSTTVLLGAPAEHDQRSRRGPCPSGRAERAARGQPHPATGRRQG